MKEDEGFVCGLITLILILLLGGCGTVAVVKHFLPTVPTPAPLPVVKPLPPAPPETVLVPADTDQDLEAQLTTWQQAEADARNAAAAADEAKAQAVARGLDAERNIRQIGQAQQDRADAAEAAWISWAALVVVIACIVGAGLCVALAMWVPILTRLARGGGYCFTAIAVCALLVRGLVLYLPWVMGALVVAGVIVGARALFRHHLAKDLEVAGANAKRIEAEAHLGNLHAAVEDLAPSLGAEAQAVVAKAGAFLGRIA